MVKTFTKSVLTCLLITAATGSGALMAQCVPANSNVGVFETYVVMNAAGAGNQFYDLAASTTNPDFNAASLGTFGCNGSLIIAGGENKTFKCNGCNVTGSTLRYRVYPTGSPSGSFIGVNLPFSANLAGGCGGDQRWQNTANTTNIITGLNPGNYTVQVYSETAYNSCGTGTCFASNGGANYAATFIVGPAPAVGASASPAAICQGAATTLTGTGATTYAWMPGSLTGTTVSVSPAAGTTYTVTGTDAGSGCTATATVQVTVTPAPVCQNGGTADLQTCGCNCLPGYAGALCQIQCATGATAGSNGPLCAGANLNLTSSATGTTPVYSWSGPNGFTSAVQNPTLAAATTAAAGTYTVTVTNACGSTSASTLVAVNANPIVITGMKSNAALFGGVGTAGITTQPAGCTYLWSPGAQTTGYIQNQTPGTYQVTVTAPGGCTKVKSIIIN